MSLELNEVGAVVFSVVMGFVAAVGIIVLVNAARFAWTNRKRRHQ